MTARTDKPPRRTLDKQEAIRHLIHTAIRLIVTGEDPFAVHVLAHSAEKTLTELAKKKNQILRMDWEVYIKPQYHKQFFALYRDAYNYFKHADKDLDDLPVYDIMRINIMALFMCVSHYHDVFGEITSHMVLLLMFVMTLSPELIEPTAMKATELLEGVHDMESMTPREYFTMFEENIGILPGYIGERSKDLADITDFYNLSFSELRAGKTKSTRIFHIRDYS